MHDRPNPLSMRLPSQSPRRPAAPTATLGNSENPISLDANIYGIDAVTEPQIVCPNCPTEIKLTQSLAPGEMSAV